MLKKICEICGMSFEARHANQKYCEECGRNPRRAKRQYQQAVLINKINAGDFDKISSRDYVCEQCGRKFISYNGAKFCSTRCYKQHNIESARCSNCGKHLVDFGIKIETTGGWHYCSDACREDFRLKRAREDGRLKTCLRCGKEYISSSKSSKFCSNECYRAAMRDGWRPKRIDSPSMPMPMYTTHCPNCGKVAIKCYNVDTYCSKECRKDGEKKKRLRKAKEKMQEEIKKRGLCFLCKTPYADCERMSSSFQYSPEGAVFDESGKIVKCPKFCN